MTGSVEPRDATTYRLEVDGLVDRPATYTLDDLRALPQTGFTKDFHCVTGWVVPDVEWRGVRLADLLDLAGPTGEAGAVQFRSFDGTYTESLAAGRRPRGRRGGGPRDARRAGHPRPRRAGAHARRHSYGYKGTKWLSGIRLTAEEVPGYWEERGYDIDGTIRE